MMVGLPLSFLPPRDAIRLREGEVHLWRLAADTPWESWLPRLYNASKPSRGRHGKPQDPSGALAWAVSDSGPWLAVAVARGGPLGLDLECDRPLRQRARLLKRCFTAREQAALGPCGDRLILRVWTLKEAVVKAHGRGLAYGLKRIETRLVGGWPVLDRLEGEAGPAERWAVFTFELAEGCDATLLTPVPAPVLRCFAPLGCTDRG
ncbi:MAG: hypothetical protein KatS3mg125_0467 [Lysobacterales bacterium]|jgi:4'-phosphopantetheinyl transferase|nr:MAG: hypothetical protein KatS3mg125_0467 [Xanthomonadales bacterium]